MATKAKKKPAKKKKPVAEKKQGGQPTVMTKDVLRDLKHAFSIGATDLEACFYAGIGKTALYDYQRKNPKYTEEKELLKEKTILKARQEVVKGLDGDPDFALKYLERKRKKEFGLGLNVDGKVEHMHTIPNLIRQANEIKKLNEGTVRDLEYTEET